MMAGMDGIEDAGAAAAARLARVESVQGSPELAAITAVLLGLLPDWFGIAEANAQYAESAKRLPGFLARGADGEPIGVLLYVRHFAEAAEIHLMAVAPDRHRQGVGAALVAAAEAALRADDCRVLQVKTLGPSDPDAGYAATRAFYRAVGFLPVEELRELWPGNPCLLMIKMLREKAPMNEGNPFLAIPPTTLADILGRSQIMDIGIRALWTPAPAVAGPAYTVRCVPGDNLMLHAAIYRAEPGSVIVVESGDTDYALAGGNVCAVAHRRGVSGFVLDGLIRDIGEAREDGFPVYGRGVIPIPGAKRELGSLGGPVTVGGVLIRPGDVVVAGEEGVAVVPADRGAEVLAQARARLAKEATETLDDWERRHRAKIEKALGELGFTG